MPVETCVIAVAPVLTVAPVPVVVVVAMVLPPWVMFITNWSPVNCRPVAARAFCSIRCG